MSTDTAVPNLETPIEKPTLAALVASMVAAEDGMSAEGFDPQTLVGELQDKVDAIHMVLERMESASNYLSQLAKPLIRKAKAIANNRERLRDYVTFTMKQHNFESLPGTAFKVTLRASPPSLIVNGSPTAKDYMDFPEFVEMTRSYQWKNDVIKEALAEGRAVPLNADARLETSHWPDFKANVPEKLESKKKTKATKAPKVEKGETV